MIVNLEINIFYESLKDNGLRITLEVSFINRVDDICEIFHTSSIETFCHQISFT